MGGLLLHLEKTLLRYPGSSELGDDIVRTTRSLELFSLSLYRNFESKGLVNVVHDQLHMGSLVKHRAGTTQGLRITVIV